MELPEKPSFRPVVWGLVAAILGLILFHAGGIRFGDFAHMQAYGGWRDLFSITPRELGYHVLSHLCLLPGALLLAVGFFRASNGELGSRLSRWVARVNARRFLLGLGLTFVAVALLLRTFILQGAPLTDDEGVYLLQARMLLDGKLSITPAPDETFFKNAFMVNWNHRWFPIYPWAHPFLLALGLSIKAPALVPPLLGVATMLLTYAIANELCGKGAALGAATLFVLSPFAEYQAATFLSESTSAVLVAAAAFAYLKLERQGDWKWAALCGAALAAAVNCRPLTALGAAVALGCFSMRALIRTRGAFVRRVWPAIPTALLGVGIYLLLNWIAQGDAIVPAPLLHGSSGILGFASVDPKIHSSSPELSLLVTADYLMKLNAWLFGWPSSLIFAVVVLAIPSARSRMALPLSLVGTILGAYFFCRFPAVDDVGPVYMLDAAPFLIIATVAGIGAIAEAFTTAGLSYLSELPTWGAIAMFLIATPVFHRTQAVTLRSLSNRILAPLKLVQERGLHQALVFMANRNVPRPLSWVYYPPLPKPDFSDDVLYVRDSLAEADAIFAAQHPERTPYRLRRNWEGQWQLAALGSAASADDAMKLSRVGGPPDPATIPLIPKAE